MKIKDTVTGALFTAVGIGFMTAAYQYPLGTTTHMGPGYFPLLISTALTAIGIVLLLKGLIWKS